MLTSVVQTPVSIAWSGSSEERSTSSSESGAWALSISGTRVMRTAQSMSDAKHYKYRSHSAIEGSSYSPSRSGWGA